MAEQGYLQKPFNSAGHSGALPSGTITFLFTDIEGSTKLWQEYPDQMKVNLARHDAMLRAAIEQNNGYVFKTVGDAFCAAFPTATHGVAAAIEAQKALANESWGECGIKVRMGLHTGDAEERNSDYFGNTVNRVARLMSAGHGGQTLLSLATQELIRDKLPNGVSLVDLGERRLKDLIRPEHIFQLNIPGLATAFAPLKTLDAYRHNLPAQTTSFIGREKEMENIKQALAGHRLVTLTGPGGTGKTRLSLQVATDLLDQFPDGIWFVELAPITDQDLIPQAILSAADMQPQPGKTQIESLTDFLRQKTSLLVLDNCEHLIESCAKLVDVFLRAAPNLKILASSREALGLGGEVAWRVPSLSLPDPNSLLEMEQLTQYEAVRLFIDRVQLVSPHFALSKDNASAIAQICCRLDGIPLALELAAARARSISVEQIMSRLDDRFRLLTGGSRTALPRQQTLRALIDWSYDLLTDPERLLLRRLAVFMGGWTLELAETVCAGVGQETILSYDVLDLLTRLVDKSLVSVDEQQGEMRYRILETVRQYVREKLFETGEGAELRHRHCVALANLVEQIAPELNKDQAKKWFHRMDAELENIRAAIGWALETRDAPNAMRLCLAMDNYWDMRSLAREAVNYCREALALVEQDDTLRQTPGYALLLALKIIQEIVVSRNLVTDSAILATLEQATALLASHNFPKKSFRAFWQLVDIYLTRQDIESAEKVLQQLLEGSRQVGDDEGVAWALCFLAYLSFEKGDGEKLDALITQSRDLFLKIGDRIQVVERTYELSWHEWMRGNSYAARKNFEAGLRTAQELELDPSIKNGNQRLGDIAYMQGDYEVAAKYYQAAEACEQKSGDPVWVNFYIFFSKGNFAFGLGDVENACRYYEVAIANLRENQSEVFAGSTMKRYGLALLRAGRADEARQQFEQCIAQMEKVGQQAQTDLAWFGLGELERLAGNLPLALRYYQRALFLRNKRQLYVFMPDFFDGFAKLALAQGDLPQATRWFGFADELHRQFGTVRQPVDRFDYDQQVELLKSQMSTAEFESARAEGCALMLEQAVPIALKKDGEP